jgi:hypothetical protein
MIPSISQTLSTSRTARLTLTSAILDEFILLVAGFLMLILA